MADPRAKDSLIDMYQIHGDEVIPYWDWLEPYIEKALEYDDTMRAEHVLDQVLKGDALVWIIHKDNEFAAVAVTQIVNYPAKKLLEIMTLTGLDFDEWADNLQLAFEWYVEENRLDGMRAICRPGMAKMLKRLGWVNRQEIMSYGR